MNKIKNQLPARFDTKNLTAACRSGDLSQIQDIITAGRIDSKKMKHLQPSPILAALENKKLEVVKFLFDRGAIVNIEDDLEQLTELLQKVGDEVLEYFLAKVNNQNVIRECLDIAMHRDMERLVLTVIKNGYYQIHHGDDFLNLRLFYYIMTRNYVEFAEILLKQMITSNFKQIKDLLALAVHLNCLNIVELFLKHGVHQGIERECLLRTVTHDLKDMMLLLLRYTQPELLDEDYQIKALNITGQIGDLEMTQLLVRHGLNVNKACDMFKICDQYNQHKNLEFIEFLLQNNADLSKVGFMGESLVFQAIDRPELLSLLIKYGCKVNVRNERNDSPLSKAMKLIMVDSVKVLWNHSDFEYSLHKNFLEYRYGVEDVQVSLMIKENVDEKAYSLSYAQSLIEFSVSTLQHDHRFCEITNVLLHCGVLVVHNFGIPERSKEKFFCPKITFFRKVALLGCPISVNEKTLLTEGNFTRKELIPLRKEIEELKTIVIGTYPRMTLYDLLLLNRNQIAKYSGNENLIKMLREQEQDFEKRFPHFGLLLNVKIKRGATRKRLMDLAFDKFSSIIACRLPRICVAKILLYLNGFQLKSFIE